MHPDTRPQHNTAPEKARPASHLEGDGHKTPGSTLVTFLVITLGMALALILAALHLGEP